MLRYAARRLLTAVPLLLVISFLAFLLQQLAPADPAQAVLHAQGVPQVTAELIAQKKAELGLDRPLLRQYGSWLASSLQLDFGLSYVTGKPVWSLLGPAFLHTLQLTAVSAAAIILLSIALGVYCALREGSWPDRAARGAAFLLTAMPPYWLAAWLVWLFSVKLDLLPTSGMDSAASFVLPVAVLAIGYAGVYFRVIRSSMIAGRNEDYVLYGRAGGLPERAVARRVLANSLQVALPMFGMAVPILLGSTVVVENVFAWPGLGTLSVKAILGRDYPVIQAFVLLLASSFVAFNAVSEVISGLLNPRLRKDLE
ncbi:MULTISPECIES: nickel/cobalt ABC transporter permease [unclassified Paenibacillus]|uniref:nickel/cobalt ABC transporter permease n=1 Tax=unclassified Paenibacillus TaxID=185978 RepID=UPI0009562567|nr:MULTISPECIES: nickel/cobalt ABC transporter permease [unclassified Paenibacillus]ASS65370.1 ABC transporter permease [Paenibacillus sp. RUD330]SIQ38467.1 nickel transport system permease protein [Paenibacillus sp. RU4X]SIQ60648.1 nickel transport system permease protein [Paenibacillus sp. RU4T]